MNHSRQGERAPSKNSMNSNNIRPHPPNEPPINTSKRPIQIIQSANEENENDELHIQNENGDNIQNTENNENLENIDGIARNSPLTNEKDQDNSWLNNLPPVIHPDEELHQELLKKRHDERLQKVTSICHCELEGILNFSFECINRRVEEKKKEEKEKKKGINRYRRDEKREELEKYEKARQTRILRTKFRNGFYTPEIIHFERDPDLLSTFVEPFHTIAIQHYLHFLSHSYLSDLSFAFNINISESHLEDPNPLFNEFIQKIYNSSEKFTKSFGTIGSLPFPYIVCVGGPSGGGRTTITQFLQKVFNAHIIQLKQIAQQGSQSKKKKGNAIPQSPKAPSSDKTENGDVNETPEIPTEYFLKGAKLIKYSDDKTAVQLISQEIKENMDGRGFIIDGYPNNKNQFAALEKELSSAGINMKKAQESLKDRIGSQRLQNSKAQFPSINGLIIALNNEENIERLVDPETGNIYKQDFNMPGIADLIGVSPVLFNKIKNDIDDRLVKVTVPPISIIPPKQLQIYSQYEGIARKTATSTIIKHCDNFNEFIESIDNFILSLYSKLPNVLPHKSDSNNVITEIFPPLSVLTKPTFLLLPQQCYSAVIAWYNCLDLFGKTIANQSNLIYTLDSKLDAIMKRATERYQLLIGQKDERKSICDDFVKKNMNNSDGNYNLPQLFRTIWDLSLKIRNKNIERVDEVVAKSGLVEVLIELKESPKTFFIALVQRMLYIKWFYENYQYLITGKKIINEDKSNNEEVNEKENENKTQNENKNDQESEKEQESKEEDVKNKGKESKLKNNKKQGKESKLKNDKKKGKESKLKNDKKQGKGKNGKDNESQRDDESQKEISIEIDEPKEEEESILDKLTNLETSIPDFFLKTSPNSIPQPVIQEPQEPEQQEEDEEEELPQLSVENDQDDNFDHKSDSSTNIPTIDISQINKSFRPPNSARPIHPPDSLRDDNIVNKDDPDINTQRAEIQRVRFKNEDELQSELENRFNEMKKADFHGFDYLLANLQYFCDSSKPSNSQVMFDVNLACSQLNIQPCVMKTPFDDTYHYAVEFFNYIESQVSDNLLLSNEVKSNIAIFRRFMNLCNKKETTMVKSVFDLRDALTRYAHAKCTHEMEYFARQFRTLKQILSSNSNKEIIDANKAVANSNSNPTSNSNDSNKNTRSIKKSISPARPSVRSPRRTIINKKVEVSSPRQNKTKTIKNSVPTSPTSNLFSCGQVFQQSYQKLNGPLFEFDVKHVIKDVEKLAKLELTFDTPIVAQDLVSSEVLMKIAQCTSDLGIYHASGDDMLLVAHEVIFGIEEEEEEEAKEEEEEFKDDNYREKYLQFMKFMFCMNVLECAEHFDVLQFLLCFAHSRDEEIEIMEMFQSSMNRNSNSKPLSRSLNVMSTVHDDDVSINIFHQNDSSENDDNNNDIENENDKENDDEEVKIEIEENAS